VNRVLPYWYDYIAVDILAGKNVIVCAHGNSIRAILKHLDNIPEDGNLINYNFSLYNIFN